MEKIRQVIIFLVVSSCYFTLVVGRCLQNKEVIDIIWDCIKLEAPENTKLKEIVEIRKEMVKISEDTEGKISDSDPLKKIAYRATYCTGKSVMEVSPEMKSIATNCTASNESEKEIGECITNEIWKICPMTFGGRLKRSTFSHVNLIAWATQLNN